MPLWHAIQDTRANTWVLFAFQLDEESIALANNVYFLLPLKTKDASIESQHETQIFANVEKNNC